jgi:hypothetical protein
MNRHTLLRTAFALFATVLVTAAQAQLFRAYLASDGVDTNPCTLASPCRLLPAALAAVADAGEIWLLDSANYNTATVNLTKSVTILAIPGAVGSVVATGGPAFNINTAGVNVTLRNLVMVPGPAGGATFGVLMQGGNGLTVDGCLVANMPIGAINANVASARVNVIDSVFRGNSLNGLVFGSGVIATVANSKILGSGSLGINASGNAAGVTTHVTISDSVVAGGGGTGIYAEVISANSTINLMVTRSTIANNANHGIVSTGTVGVSNVVVSGSTISGNSGSGMVQSGGGAILTSLGNNTVRLNFVGATSGTITTIGTQ